MWPSATCASASCGVELQRLQRGRLCLVERLDPIRAEQQVRVGQPGVGERVLRVLFDRVLEVLDRLLVAGDRALVPVIAALQVQLVRLGVFGVAPRGALLLFARQPPAELVEDLGRDFLLHRQQVRVRLVVLPAPQLRAVGDVHQLGFDHEPIAARLHAAGDDRLDVQIAADLLRVDVLALVAEHDAARAHAQRRQLREAVDQAFGDAVRQVLRVARRADTDEWQHRHRVDRLRGRGA